MQMGLGLSWAESAFFHASVSLPMLRYQGLIIVCKH